MYADLETLDFTADKQQMDSMVLRIKMSTVKSGEYLANTQIPNLF